MKILKSVAVIGFIFGMSHLGLAQKIELGVKAGANFNGLNLSSGGKLVTTRYNTRVGFHLGGYMSIRIKSLALQPELIFSQQGQNFTTPYWSNLSTTLNYINLPVIFKYHPTNWLNLQVGPQLGYLISSKGDVLSTVGNPPTLGLAASGKNLKDYTNPLDFSIAFGMGIDLPLGLSLTARYNMGVTNVNKYWGSTNLPPGNITPSFSTANAQNQVFQLSLGYKLKSFGK